MIAMIKWGGAHLKGNQNNRKLSVMGGCQVGRSLCSTRRQKARAAGAQ